MGVVSSFVRSFDILKQAPALLGVAFAYTLLGSVGSVLSNLNSTVASLLGTVWNLGILLFVFPFFLGGVLYLASRGLEGDGSVGTFLEGGRSNYLYLLGYTWVVGVVELVWGIVVAIVAYILILFVGIAFFLAFAGGMGESASTAGIVIGVVVFLVLLLGFYLVGAIPIFVVQFVPGAYVIDDMDVFEGAKRGLRLLADNFVKALGFDLAVFGVFLLVGVLAYIPAVLVGVTQGWDVIVTGSLTEPAGGPGAPGASSQPSIGFSPTGLALITVPSVILSTFQFGLLSAFYTAFYDDIAPDGRKRGTEATPSATGSGPN